MTQKQVQKMSTQKGQALSEITWLIPALGAGVAKYLYEAKNKRKARVFDLFVHITSALTAGFIVGSFCSAYNLNDDIRNALVGIAGWAGAEIMSAASKQLADFLPIFFERIRLSIGVMAGFDANQNANKDEQKTEEQKENKE